MSCLIKTMFIVKYKNKHEHELVVVNTNRFNI